MCRDDMCDVMECLHLQVLSRWEKYTSQIDEYTVEQVASKFPFLTFFENAPQPLFKGESKMVDRDIAEGCFRHIKRVFAQLDVSTSGFLLLYTYL